MFYSTLLDTWAKGRSSHILTRNYRDGRSRQFFFKQNSYGRRDVLFCLRLRIEATESWMGWWDIPSAEETDISKVPHQGLVDDFFNCQGVVHQEFVPEVKIVIAEFYKGLMDRPLKRFQRVRPAAICWREFFLFRNNAPAKNVASVCQFLTPKMLHPFITPRTLQSYLRQTIFSSSSLKWS